MAGADQGANGGLPASEEAAASSTSPTAPAGLTSDTQLVPLVAVDSPAAADSSSDSSDAPAAVDAESPADAGSVAAELGDAPTVRAVARRAAAALPAIGRTTTARVVPRSARSTVERQSAPSAVPASEQAVSEAAEPVMPEPVASEPTVSEPVAFEPVAFEPDAPEAVAAEPVVPEPVVPELVVPEPVVAEPVPAPAGWEPVPAEPAIDAEIVPGNRTDLPAGDRPIEGEVPFYPGQRDEWVEPAPAKAATEVLPVATEPAPTAVALLPAVVEPRSEPGTDLVRRGPAVLAADSWDTDPDESINQTYHGRRRAVGPSRNRWLLVALGLLLVTIAVAVPLALRSGNDPAAAPPGLLGTESNTATTGGPSTPVGELGPPSSSPGAPRSTPSLAATTGANVPVNPTTPAGSPPPTGGSTPTASPTPTATTAAPFSPVTLQAENASYTGTRENDPPCGVSSPVVRVGKWESTQPPYTLTFTTSVPTAGNYQLRIYYVMSSGDPRTLELTVNGASVPAGQFSSCAGSRDLTIPLNAGSNQIKFNNQNQRAPSIDRIVISRP